MHIASYEEYPGNELSNFANHQFMVDRIVCNSMEGFIQSLKWANPILQETICKLTGKTAYWRSQRRTSNWKQTQILHWQSEEYPRHSEEYTKLLNRAYNALYVQCPEFRAALKATGKEVLTHKIGQDSVSKTLITKTEFCNRLMHLRDRGRLPV